MTRIWIINDMLSFAAGQKKRQELRVALSSVIVTLINRAHKYEDIHPEDLSIKDQD
ncbi:hypothetical protein [Vibrio harveyi]|uniref:hypothetical protein n=1 Tax=Vibrio harveyi TaxID=669 RepID=UPI00142E0E77|nr:hypothetical protein [Vibrio harveyi]